MKEMNFLIRWYLNRDPKQVRKQAVCLVWKNISEKENGWVKRPESITAVRSPTGSFYINESPPECFSVFLWVSSQVASALMGTAGFPMVVSEVPLALGGDTSHLGSRGSVSLLCPVQPQDPMTAVSLVGSPSTPPPLHSCHCHLWLRMTVDSHFPQAGG